MAGKTRRRSVSPTAADIALASVVAPVAPVAPVDPIRTQVSQRETTCPSTFHGPRGIDFKGMRLAEARSSVASAAALQAFHRSIIATVKASGLNDRDFLDAYHRYCLAAKASDPNGVCASYERTEPRLPAWISKMRKALEAYPNAICTAEEGDDYRDVLAGRPPRSKAPKGEGTAEDTLKMLLSLVKTYHNRGGDLETLVTRIDERWNEIKG
jgi:hypothetical protein